VDGNTYIVWGLGSDGNTQDIYNGYVEKFGQDNADYLMQVLGNWQSNYKRGAYIDMNIGDGRGVEAIAMQECSQFGWMFERLEGNLKLIERLFSGDWECDFLVIQPSQKLVMAAGDEIIQSEGIN
jgi:hypothetical protein